LNEHELRKMTPMKLVVACALLGTVLSTNEVSQSSFVSSMTLKSMERFFSRSEQAHQASLAAITRGMSMTKAVQVLEKSNVTTPALVQVTDMVQKTHLRKRKPEKGYSGIDGARRLLNSMIFESMSKYDAEIEKCTDYYASQCAAMEACRGQIAASNYIAANSRALILDSQSTINRCETDIPVKKLELKQHNMKCTHELHKMNTRLKIVMGDIAVMTMILEMTDCAKKLLQMKKFAMVHCEDTCTKKKFVEFNHQGLQQKMLQLKSEFSQNLVAESFGDLFQGVESLESMEDSSFSHALPKKNKTKFMNPPMPRTEVPKNPCTDPNKGAPSAADKRAAKCTIKKSPQCYKLQERFLLIQAGIQDERDQLMEEIASMEKACKETKETMETQIQDDADMLAEAQTKLAGATEKEANAGETARQTATENNQLNQDLVKQMKTCSGNYINFETELCALKKIRGELYKMKGGGHSAFFQDCEVSKWDPEECTKKCRGGSQKLTRSVLTHPDGGAKCLPLAAMKRCNLQPCPIDCKLSAWSGWSKCSSECGGGVQQRLREVKMAMKYGGKPCGETSETTACNAQACEKDCELSGWTKWTTCSKGCDGGTQKRQKYVKQEPVGEGKCFGEWSKQRLEYKKCNFHACFADVGSPVLECKKTTDVILLIDGSGSLGKKGWAAEMTAAGYFIDAFTKSKKANMAVILYSGPKTWSGVKKCTGKSKKKVSSKECGITTVTHFTEDLKKVKQLVLGLEWPKGSTLTSLALMAAKAELALGRKNSPSNVIVFTDGRPLSFRKTGIASKALRKLARLVWVPVTHFAPLKYIKQWATRRWQENVVQVKNFKAFENPEVVTHIIANICPEKPPKMEMEMPMEGEGMEEMGGEMEGGEGMSLD